MEPQKKLVGGSFAPPLTDELMLGYRKRINALPDSPVRSALTTLAHCCGIWWELPEPTGTKTSTHATGNGMVVELQADHKELLDEHIPWKHELDAIQLLLDSISNETDRDLRNMAFHLLWHVKELDLGREPLTKDKL